jgi:hypothetical protein
MDGRHRGAGNRPRHRTRRTCQPVPPPPRWGCLIPRDGVQGDLLIGQQVGDGAYANCSRRDLRFGVIASAELTCLSPRVVSSTQSRHLPVVGASRPHPVSHSCCSVQVIDGPPGGTAGGGDLSEECVDGVHGGESGNASTCTVDRPSARFARDLRAEVRVAVPVGHDGLLPSMARSASGSRWWGRDAVGGRPGVRRWRTGRAGPRPGGASHLVRWAGVAGR